MPDAMPKIQISKSRRMALKTCHNLQVKFKPYYRSQQELYFDLGNLRGLFFFNCRTFFNCALINHYQYMRVFLER